jgi:four helix bundle protein
MRKPEELRVFQMADRLAVEVYQATKAFPPEEKYGLTNQIRRAAMSVPSNLVEGCSRESVAEFRRFVEIALGSAMELEYQLGFALRIELVSGEGTAQKVQRALIVTARENAGLVCRSLNSFIQALRSESQEPTAKSQEQV